MKFNFSSKSGGSESSSSSSSSFKRVKIVDTVKDLEKIIKDAKSVGVKKIKIKDRRSSPIKIGYSDLFGTKANVSLLPDTEQIYEIDIS